MNLYRHLDINIDEKKVISIVGGGGKTTTMFKLANEFKNLGKKVLITTTTAIMKPSEDEYDTFVALDEVIGDEEILKEAAKPGTITVAIGNLIRTDKVKGLEEEVVDYIYNEDIFDYILVEADGAKRRSIKMPRLGEPLIPNSTDIVIGLIGMDVYGKKVDEKTVHRVDIFKEKLSLSEEDIIDEEVISSLVIHPEGLFKDCDDRDKYLILNKADNNELKRASEKIKESVLESSEVKNIIITSYKNGEIIS